MINKAKRERERERERERSKKVSNLEHEKQQQIPL